jgi:hypothetical protein
VRKLLTGSDLGTASWGAVMRTITFTAEDWKALAHDRYHHPDPRVQRTMDVLWLKSHGLTHDQIVAYADVSRSSVPRDLDQDLEGGLPRLRRCRWNHPQSALDEHEVRLEEYFRKHPPRSAKQAQAVIEQRTGIRRGLIRFPESSCTRRGRRCSLWSGRPAAPGEHELPAKRISQVRHFLKDHLRLRWRKTGAIPVPPRKTVEEHARKHAVFLQEQVGPRLEEARQGRRQVSFVDAAHVVVSPFLDFLRCAARRFVRAASGRKRSNVLGASDAVTHRLIRVTNDDSINAESVRALARGGGGGRGVADHAGAGQRAVPEVRGGAGSGGVVGDRVVGPAQ